MPHMPTGNWWRARHRAGIDLLSYAPQSEGEERTGTVRPADDFTLEQPSAQEASCGMRSSSRGLCRGRRAGYSPFSQRTPAVRTEVFVQFTGGQDQQQPFTHRLGAFAFRAIEFAGDEVTELLAHGLKSLRAPAGCRAAR